MIIREFEVFGFGPLLESKFQFEPKGMNLVLGPNESGKTTLCKAIISTIYGFSSQQAIQQFQARSVDGRFEGKILLEAGEASYEISRDFATHAVTIVKLLESLDPEEIFNGRVNPLGGKEGIWEYQNILRQEIGLPSKNVLSNTAYISQIDVGITLDDDLRRQISGAGQADYKKARQLLRRRYFDLSGETLFDNDRHKIGTKIELLEKEIAGLESELLLVIEGRERFNQLEIEFNSKQAEFQQISDQIIEKNTHVRVIQGYLGDLVEYDNLMQRKKLVASRQNLLLKLEERVAIIEEELNSEKFSTFKDLDNKELELLKQCVHSDIEESIDQLNKIIYDQLRVQEEIDDQRFDSLRTAPENTGEILGKVKLLEEEIVEQQEKIQSREKIDEKRNLKLSSIVPYVLFLAGGIIGGILGSLYMGFNDSSISPILGIVIGAVLVSFPLGIVGLFMEQSSPNQPNMAKLNLLIAETRLKEAKNKKEALISNLSPLVIDEKSLPELTTLWAELDLLQSERDTYSKERETLESRDIINAVENPKISDIVENETAEVLKEQLDAYDGLRAELNTKKESLEELTSNGDTLAENIQGLLDKVKFQLDALEEQFPNFSIYRENPVLGTEHLDEYQNTLENLESQKKQIWQEVHKAELDLASCQILVNKNPVILQEQIERSKEDLRKRELLRDALFLAISTLDESISEYEEDQLSRLSSQTSHYFKLFTEERYVEVRLEADQITVIDNHGQEFDLSHLSTGAKDQLFLALRIAITELLSADSVVPIIMDDTFVNFDQTRLKNALDIVSQISLERQVILLSHDEGLKNWAEKVIELN